jgi:SAM-dependent methyltransferase
MTDSLETIPSLTTRDDRPQVRPAGPSVQQLEHWSQRFPYYTQQLIRLFKIHIPLGSSILEIGCHLGDLLAALSPSNGVGICARADCAAAATARHTDLQFIHADPADFDLGNQTFDFIIISTVLGNIRDVQKVFEAARRACRPDTRIIIAYYNALWEPILRLATHLGMRRVTGEQNWLSVQDLSNLLYLAELEPIRTSSEVLLPVAVPVLSGFFNRFLVRFWPWTHLGLVQLIIAKPTMPAVSRRATVSVIIPTRNERGNIAAAVQRTPEMGGGTEIIFVDGNSTDDTAGEIEKQIAANPQRNMRLILQGGGVGKGDAVRKGFAAAGGDVLMILDADLTMPPEYLPRFFDALVRGRGEFVNGTRLVYPMEDQAMRFLNKLGNRFFSAAFTWLLNQPIRDTLCGTKVLTKQNYDVIAANRSYFGDFDPFGDFDLILGAARANLKIVDIPIRYEARRYGTTNISRFRHGLLLLKMSWFAFCRLKLR